MDAIAEGKVVTRDAVLEGVVRIINDMTLDWDLTLDGAITETTGLVDDLGFESIDIVEFAVALEEFFARKRLPFERLFMRDGMYVQEIRVAEVVDFLVKQLNC